ncbi:MAG: helix-turn-helix domain-containing protein [Anaerolineae bacterium]|nr:helix-turn-helix domain-containing protein [Anaerolineae bacterium]
MNGYRALGDLIRSEMNIRRLSATAFADMVGVSTATITKCLNGEEGYPSVEFLLKLSDALNIDLCTLIAFAFPDSKARPDPEVMILADRLSKLSDEGKALIRMLVFKNTGI